MVSRFTSLVLPQHAQLVSSIAKPANVGELSIMLWLLFTGFGADPLDDPNNTP